MGCDGVRRDVQGRAVMVWASGQDGMWIEWTVNRMTVQCYGWYGFSKPPMMV